MNSTIRPTTLCSDESEIRIANHKPADTLKKAQLLFNAFELMLELPNSAGHDLYYGSLKDKSRGTRADLSPANEMRIY